MRGERGAVRARGGLRFFAGALVCFGSSLSCLPSDTRPPPASMLLTLTPTDETAVPTADGWSLSVDHLLLGIGDAMFDFNCNRYGDAHYGRLLDARWPMDQKIGVIFGLGRCYFTFLVGWPNPDTLLGEGVSQADKERMGAEDPVGPGPPQGGIAIEMAVTATRGAETKRIHWSFAQVTTYQFCGRAPVDGTVAQAIELKTDDNFNLHLGIRATALFRDDFDASKAVLRFDPIAAADSNGDDDVTLDELSGVTMDTAQRFGPYGLTPGARVAPRTLADYLYLVLLAQMVGFREDFVCQTALGFRPN